MLSKNVTLLKKEVEWLNEVGGYWIVKVRCTYRLTGEETVIIEQLGSSSNSPMEAEKFAIKALEDQYYEK